MLNAFDKKISIRLNAVWIFVAVFVTACAASPGVQKPVTFPAVIAKQLPHGSAADEMRKKQLNEFLFQGLQAFDANKLSEPFAGSAVDYFRRALDIDPQNKLALEGMSKVANRYLALAKEATANGSLSVANTYLSKAKRFGGEEIPTQLDVKKTSKKIRPPNEFLLPLGDLNKRGEKINLRLTEIAVKAMRADSRIAIEARDDAEGRWIYQQMRQVLVDYRLRGNIVRGSIPKVTLIDLTQ